VLAGLAVVVVAVGGGVALSRGEHSGGAQATKAIVANGSTAGAPTAIATVGKQGAASAQANHGRLANRATSVQAPPSGTTSATGGPHGGAAASGAGAGSRSAVAEVRDPEEAKSFPLPASVHHARARAPSVDADAAIAPGAASDAEIRKELGEEARAKAQERAAQHRILTPVAGGFSVGGNGTIPIPTDVPEAIQRVIAGGNAIADFPYIWGGGHGSFVANGYDCSGSVSYALAAGGLLSSPLVSGDLASWGEPGPGRWITIYANAGHTFMSVDGMWFDTAGRSGPYASRWLVSTPSLVGYSVRHPPGF
jgi:cell wall-associated NlpC family hydrolase